MSQVEKDVEAALQNVSVYLQIRLVTGLFVYIMHSSLILNRNRTSRTLKSIVRIVLKSDIYTF